MTEGGTTFDGTAATRRGARARRWAYGVLWTAGLLSSASGCRYANYAETIGNDTTWVDRVSAEVDAGPAPGPIDDPLIRPVTLRTIEEQGEPTYWDISLDEVIVHAMTNSKVLRDLGGTILSAPATIATKYTQPIQQTDPRFGMEGALSAFDAQLNGLYSFQSNRRVYNNRFLGGGANFFQQERHDYVTELSKYGATGAQFALNNTMDYDDNNAPGNLFGSAWQTQWSGTIRQPLMQGAGLTYNRIAGPGGQPGVPQGILIAKVNQDMTSAEFNLAVRNYLSDVINAYWDLYFAYRDLDAKQQALDRARDIWQAYEAEKAADRKGGVAEALSREQFFRFQSELEDAIAGRAGQRTQNKNGTTGGAFRGVNGVQAAERRLRLLIGFPVNDVRILRPASDPELAPVVFDWESMTGEAMHRRPELQKQRLLVKRREMELIAAKNYLQPQLDLYGTYRLRGLGHDLMGNDERDGLRSAYGELGTADFREWEAGLQFSMPIGFRQGHAAVQNAELQLARDRVILREQERQILKDLSDMIAEVDRAFKQCQTNLNRYLAAKDGVEALEANREAGLPVNLEQVLDVHRRLSEAQTQYYLARSEYAVALKNVHLEKGSLLEYGNVMLCDNRTTGDFSIESGVAKPMLAEGGSPTATTSVATAEPQSTAATSPSSVAPAEQVAGLAAVAPDLAPLPKNEPIASGAPPASLHPPALVTAVPTESEGRTSLSLLDQWPAAEQPRAAETRTSVAIPAETNPLPSIVAQPPAARPDAESLFRREMVATDPPAPPPVAARVPQPTTTASAGLESVPALAPLPVRAQEPPASARPAATARRSDVPLPPPARRVQPASHEVAPDAAR